MILIDANVLLGVSHDIYREAADIILKEFEDETTIEGKARLLMPQKLAHEFFAHLARCRTKKSRIKALKLLAGICGALAYELAMSDEEEKDTNNAD